MKICMISKYPPIEGGVSSKTYWTAKALGERGHEVHIVTNALEVEEEYREGIDINDPNYTPKNVHVHNPAPDILGIGRRINPTISIPCIVDIMSLKTKFATQFQEVILPE